MSSELALAGGKPVVKAPHPHCPWPPTATAPELAELAEQRNSDISIKGKSGPIKDFEDAFKAFLANEVEYTVSFNSGTSALLAAYCSIGIDEGDEIIGPCLTFHAALSPAFLLKAQIVLVDIDVRTRCIDPTKIEQAITPRTKAITVVHQWGHAADMDAILAIADKHKLAVVEDCSHAHGSKYKGKFCGTFGDVAVFSLQAAKAVFAGEGGILVTNNALYHDRATLLGHYRDRSRDELADPALSAYWVTGFGQKFRMSPFNAIVAKHSLASFPAIEAGRSRCLRYFAKRLEEVSYIVPPYVDPDVHMGAWYGFKPLYKEEELGKVSRQRLVEALQAEGMKVSAPSAPLLTTLPLYNSRQSAIFRNWQNNEAKRPEDYPAALLVQNTALSLPTFYDWEKHRPIIDQYIDAFKKVGDNAQEICE